MLNAKPHTFYTKDYTESVLYLWWVISKTHSHLQTLTRQRAGMAASGMFRGGLTECVLVLAAFSCVDQKATSENRWSRGGGGGGKEAGRERAGGGGKVVAIF